MIRKSFAKINITLEILGKRNDGYHNTVPEACVTDVHDAQEEGREHRGDRPRANQDLAARASSCECPNLCEMFCNDVAS